MLPDYHMHTYLSDGKDTHEDMVSSAAFKGIPEIGFTDHISIKPVGWAMEMSEINTMIEKVNAVRKNDTKVVVKLGAEIDYYSGMEKQIGELIDSIPFDFTIGSVHFINDWNFDTDIRPYDQISIDKFYTDYFKLVQQSAKSGLFDIIGHCDLAKKFGYYPSFRLERLYEETAKIFRKAGVVVELNTSGKGKPCAEFYPSAVFLEKLAKYKVPITLGSDAHVEQNIGQFFEEAVSELKALGYKEIIKFNKRKRETQRI
ncbi:MAG: histidinol-phosphatase HisJ family protein [Bacteroidales bacterium]|nr:histidinol-phosphatase HisJ family protein [Bacteroidales bacterium]